MHCLDQVVYTFSAGNAPLATIKSGDMVTFRT